ncbi:MAG TPA: Ig-like domain-containing protein [Patescibacteria group bacterium]|nr:Ig-like domain-containing protein [Patescibacteria group bacterium]
MKKGLWNQRIPTIFGLLILLVGIGVSSVFIRKGVNDISRAGPEKVPQNVIISNVTDSSFTVNFTTNAPTVSGVQVEDGQTSPFVVYDDRNKKTGEQNPYYSHYITVTGLNPNTDYKFSILSDGETYLLNGNKYSITTGTKINGTPPNQSPIVGKILMPDGSAATDTIVELRVPSAERITALTQDNGNYIIPTNSIRNNTLNGYITLKQNEDLTLVAYRQNLQAQVKIAYQENSTIPPLTLAQSYDFSDISTIEESTIASQLKAPATQGANNGNIAITVPTNSQSFVDSQPSFKGTGVANRSVTIQIEPGTSSTLSVGSNGVWTYRPTKPLDPGTYKLTIQGQNKSGTTQSVTRSFSIFAAGSQIAGSGPTTTPTPKPSATPTRTPTATPTRVPTAAPTTSIPSPTLGLSPTSIPTTSPTIALTPTITPSISGSPTATLIPTATLVPPTATPTQVVINTPPPIATPPPTGNTTPLVLTAVSIILIIAGGALLFML